MVVLYHFWPVAPSPTPGLPQAVGKGYLWVDLFFVLSAYVLALNYGSVFANHPFSPRAFGVFLMRRVARIYPAYIVLLVLQLGFVLVAYGNVTEPHYWGGAVALNTPAWDIPANVLLAQSVGQAPSLLGQAWSMSAEFVTYCAFPLLVNVSIFGNRQIAALSLFGAGVLLVAVIICNASDGAKHAGALDAYDCTQLTPLMRCLGDFILGLLAFRASKHQLIARFIGRDTVGTLLLVALTVMFVVGAHDLAIVGLFPALIIHVVENSGTPVQLLESGPMVRLGELSYAIYLVHPMLEAPMAALRQELEQLFPLLPAGLVSGAVIMVALWSLAWTIYHWIERPGRKMIRHLGDTQLGGA